MSLSLLAGDKVSLRRQLRQARLSLSPHQRRRAERRVACHAKPFLKRGKRIGGYVAAGSELALSLVVKRALIQHALVFLPVIPARGRRLWFSRLGCQPRWYKNRRYGLLEYAGPVVRAQQLDVLFIPLVGVDNQGYRLGQGGGYYDTTLSFRRRGGSLITRPILVGVAFDCQRVERVPCEPWDIRLDYLVTESGLYRLV